MTDEEYQTLKRIRDMQPGSSQQQQQPAGRGPSADAIKVEGPSKGLSREQLVARLAELESRPLPIEEPGAQLAAMAEPIIAPAVAAGRSAIRSSLPFVGPMALEGIDRASAGASSAVSGRPFAQELAETKQVGRRTEAENPTAAVAGTVAGAVAGAGALMKAPQALFGAGQTARAAELTQASRSAATAVEAGELASQATAARNWARVQAVLTDVGGRSLETAVTEGRMPTGSEFAFGVAASLALRNVSERVMSSLGPRVAALQSNPIKMPDGRLAASSKDGHTVAKSLYETFDNAAITITHQSLPRVPQAIREMLSGYHPRVGGFEVVNRELGRASQIFSGRTVDMSEVEALRRSWTRLGHDTPGAPGANLRSMAERLSDIIEKMPASALRSPLGSAAAQEGRQALVQARRFERVAYRTEAVERLAEQLRSGATIEQVRRSARSIVNDKDMMKRQPEQFRRDIRALAGSGSRTVASRIIDRLFTPWGLFSRITAGAMLLTHGPMAAVTAVGGSMAVNKGRAIAMQSRLDKTVGRTASGILEDRVLSPLAGAAARNVGYAAGGSQ